MKSRKKLIAAGAAVIVLVGGAWGYTTLKGATPDIDPSRIATVERGTMTKSVVATGKIEPITKVEIKSKANGIIEKMNVDVDQMVRPSDVLVELHDFIDRSISPTIISRFADTHDISVVSSLGRDPSTYSALETFNDWDRHVAVAEFRPEQMQWAFMHAKPSA